MDQKLKEVLNEIDPSILSYQEWVDVGMILKTEGGTAADWDNWSRRDPGRYVTGDCFKKWGSFDSNELKAGSLIHLAQEHGFIPRKGEHAKASTSTDRGRALAWDDEIGADKPVLDQSWIKDVPVIEPEQWDPKDQLRRYLQTLFQPEDIVGYVTETYDFGGVRKPTKGTYNLPVSELLRRLDKPDYGMDDVVGTINEDAGAWIRFNPLDGNGVDDKNVTAYRYTLVESDNTSIDRQNAIIRELKLPVAALVFSGGKSVHAIVRIDAETRDEYRERVNFLYKVCQKNGLEVDKQNKNASRLSRMPGVIRNYKGVPHKQFLMDINIGFGSWAEWKAYIEETSDDLPEFVNLSDVAQNPPELAPELIHGILRRGHKMLIAGPSKAGKSYMLINLALAFAYGGKWLGRYRCQEGRVLYINLEIDEASAIHRVLTVADAMSYEMIPPGVKNLDMWNLRGNVLDANGLANILSYRCKDKNYEAIIIDPIYKLNTGDENSAGDMAKFLGQFDRICHETGAAAIYCHHFTKGAQGGKKAMDRASGSGVFARDPDAIITLTDLERTKDQETWLHQNLESLVPDWRTQNGETTDEARNRIIDGITGWRVDMTLREFQSPPSFEVWWAWPVHILDRDGVLKEGHVKGEAAADEWKDKGVEFQKKKREGNVMKLEMAFSDLCKETGTDTVKIKDLVDDLGASRNSVKNWINESDYLERDEEGNVYRTEPEFPI